MNNIFVPSAYNLAVQEAVLNGSGDIVVEAVAGSGKTSQMEYLATQGMFRSANVLFLAFNKTIVAELTKRLGASAQCSTLNSLGRAALCTAICKRNPTLDANKYSNLVFDAVKNMVHRDKIGETSKAVTTFVSHAQSSLVNVEDTEALRELQVKYGLDIPMALSERDTFNLIRSVLTTGELMARSGITSFDDQIWLPAKWNLKTGNADWVCVDEAQDLSAAKLVVALNARGSQGRMLFVGDSFQAIYGFAGADSDSITNIIAKTQPQVLPLSICYRCPKAVVADAKAIVPHIEASPTAAEGEVNTISDVALPTALQAGDLVLCRLTAPLITLCIKLIGMRIPARVKGRDIGKSLVTFARTALGDAPWSAFGSSLEFYVSETEVKLRDRLGINADTAVQTLRDKAEGVRICYDNFQAATFADWAAQVEALFSDDTAVIELSTIHRAKGLEADHVYILKPECLPLKLKNQAAYQVVQENNLDYVARTRARKILTRVITSKS